MSMSLSDIAVLNFNGSGYPCTICGTGKNNATTLMENVDLAEKSGTSYNIKIFCLV